MKQSGQYPDNARIFQQFPGTVNRGNNSFEYKFANTTAKQARIRSKMVKMKQSDHSPNKLRISDTLSV